MRMVSLFRVKVAIQGVGVLLLTLALGLSLGCFAGGGNPIVFVSDADGNPELYLLNPASGETTRLTNNKHPDLAPVWSPDGANIAYISEESGDSEIHIIDRKGVPVSRLTLNQGVDAMPRWAPGGGEPARLVFVSERETDGETAAEIYAADAEGNDLTRVTFNDTADQLGDWSPDGDWVVFYNQDTWEERGLWLRNPAGVNLVRLTQGEDSQPAWSPDGRYIAFVRQEGDTASIYTISRVGEGGWQDELETERLTPAVADDTSPVWRPDSKTLAFVSHRDGNPEIYTMQADGGNQRRLTRNAAADQSPVWSPDGGQIAFVTYLYGTAEILVMNADGSSQRRLTTNDFDDTAPDW